MSYDVGVDAILNVIIHGNAYLLPVQLRGVSPTFSRATQPVLLSNGVSSAGIGNTLVGYTPSTGAASGFTIGFALPYAPLVAAAVTGGTPSVPVVEDFGTPTAAVGAHHILKALTTYYAGGATVLLHLGSAGDISCDGCFLRTLTVTGTEGGFITCTAAFDSKSLPTTTPSYIAGTSTQGDVYKFVDVKNFVVPTYDGATWGTTTLTDVNSFTFTVTQTLAAFRGNSKTGIAKQLSVVRTEASLDLEYLKTDVGEQTASLGDASNAQAQTGQTCSVTLRQLSIATAAAIPTVTITLTNAFQDLIPQQQGDTETYLTERMTLKALPDTSAGPGQPNVRLFTITGNANASATLP